MLYQELQPVDTYTLKLSTPLSDYDRQLLTLFYQPLTGSEAMSLFLTMWADADINKNNEFTHYHLMNLLTMPLQEIFQARISLEAIGILRSYVKTEGEHRAFVYELLPPLDAQDFFHDPLLATFLFSKIGEKAYRDLRSRFVSNQIDTTGYKETSRNFLDVYTPVKGNAHELQNDQQLTARKQPARVPFDSGNFDFDLMMSGLSEQMVPRDALKDVSRELIAKLAFMYSLNPLDMQKIIMMALNDKLEVPEERLRKSAAEFYKMNISKNAPKLEKLYITEKPKEPAAGPKTKEQELIEYVENTSPKNMLRDIIGSEPFAVDVQLAERLVNVHKLPFSVVNVLLQYVLLRNDGKITTSFAERIASHWAVNKVDTAEKALSYSRKEHDQYMKWMNEGGKSKKGGKKATREEQVPDWFYKKGEEPAAPQETSQEEQAEIEATRNDLLARLESMRNGVN